MQGFGRYSVLHQAHARAKAERTDRAAAQERKAATREVTDRRSERKDRDQAQPPKRRWSWLRKPARYAHPAR